MLLKPDFAVCSMLTSTAFGSLSTISPFPPQLQVVSNQPVVPQCPPTTDGRLCASYYDSKFWDPRDDDHRGGFATVRTVPIKRFGTLPIATATATATVIGIDTPTTVPTAQTPTPNPSTVESHSDSISTPFQNVAARGMWEHLWPIGDPPHLPNEPAPPYIDPEADIICDFEEKRQEPLARRGLWPHLWPVGSPATLPSYDKPPCWIDSGIGLYDGEMKPGPMTADD